MDLRKWLIRSSAPAPAGDSNASAESTLGSETPTTVSITAEGPTMLSTREATIPPAELFTPTYLNSSIATFFKEHFSTPPSPPIATPLEPSISKPQELSTFPPFHRPGRSTRRLLYPTQWLCPNDCSRSLSDNLFQDSLNYPHRHLLKAPTSFHQLSEQMEAVYERVNGP
jgi:hypothetical protein